VTLFSADSRQSAICSVFRTKLNALKLARIVQELEAKFGFKAESKKHDPTKPNAAA